MKIELACRYYAKGWLSFGQAARLAGLDYYSIAAEMAGRGIPRNLTRKDVEADMADARRQPGGMISAPFDLPSLSQAVPVTARAVAEFLPRPCSLRESDLARE